MKHVQRVLLILMLVAVLCSWTVCADETAREGYYKVYSVSEQAGSGRIDSTPSMAAFWEYPALYPGMRCEGQFTLENRAPRTVRLWLDTVVLPYGEEERLRYLSTLQICVTCVDDGTVLYDGPYIGMVGENGLKLSVEAMKSGEQKRYAVQMSCPFTCTQDPSKGSCPVEWRFAASAEVVGEEGPPAPAVWLVDNLPWILGGMVGLGILLAIIKKIVDRVRAHRA